MANKPKPQELLDAMMGDDQALAVGLIEAGVKVNIKDQTGMSLLDIAAQRRQVHTTRALLKVNAKITLGNSEQKNALHWAAKAKELGKFDTVKQKSEAADIIEMLLDAGSNPDKYDESGMTPLLWAVWSGNEIATQLFLERGGDADVKSKCKEGLSASHYAALIGNLGALRHLIRSGADVHALNNRNETLFHVAARSGQNQIVMALLQDGFDIDATIKNTEGQTALCIAKKNGHLEVVKSFERDYQKNFAGYQKSLTERNGEALKQKANKAVRLKRRPKR